jgi:hypothetical protein
VTLQLAKQSREQSHHIATMICQALLTRKVWDIGELSSQKFSCLVGERFFSKASSKVQMPHSIYIHNQGNLVSVWLLQAQRRAISLIAGMDGERVTLQLSQVALLLAYMMFLMNCVKELVATLLRPFRMRFG